MNVQFIGKFYDNHSLSIVNRNLVLKLSDTGMNISIIALDNYKPEANLDKNTVKKLKTLEQVTLENVDVEVRHSYPPIWRWPDNPNTKVVFIQPWEYPKAPFEWQYKFETFADMLVVPSKYVEEVFVNGGINPYKVYVVPNGINKNIFNKDSGESVAHLGIDSTKFNYVYVGNTQWRKGLEPLLNVWATTFKKADNARLIIKDSPDIYGSSNILSEIIKLQYKSGCAEIVYINDNLSDVDMANIYKASKYVVHPYRAEGFGMHVQEALACGCVPIISAGGPTEDFVPEHIGFRIPVKRVPIDITDSGVFATKPGDAMTLMSTHTFINEPDQNALRDILLHSYYTEDRNKYIDAAKAHSVTNSWDYVAEVLEECLSSVAARDYEVRNV